MPASNKAAGFFREGRLDEAIEVLNAELRENPTDAQRRTFLFELLCFAGNYTRADKQLDLLAGEDANRRIGSLLYRAAIHAEQTRQELFEQGKYPKEPAAEVAGTFNGKPFTYISDGDARVGERLEVFAAGTYLWIPFEHIASVEMEPPKRLRDLLWIPAVVKTGSSFQGAELGEILLPVLAPFSWRHSDNEVRLGRQTVWEESASGPAVPYGQKTLILDDEEIPILELRKLEIHKADVDA